MIVSIASILRLGDLIYENFDCSLRKSFALLLLCFYDQCSNLWLVLIKLSIIVHDFYILSFLIFKISRL